MGDTEIIALFFSRSERAIEESQKKFGRVMHSITARILNDSRDADECVNDALIAAWNTIPPQCPMHLQAFFCALARNCALTRYGYNTAAKRNTVFNTLCDELNECVKSEQSIESKIEEKECINGFLRSLDRRSRIVFMQRYFYCMNIDEIAKLTELTQANVRVILHRTRKKFKDYLEREGISV